MRRDLHLAGIPSCTFAEAGGGLLSIPRVKYLNGAFVPLRVPAIEHYLSDLVWGRGVAVLSYIIRLLSKVAMTHELGSRALRDLRDQITKESDPEKLRALVMEINVLLNLIERQVAKIEDQQPPPRH